MAAIPLQLRVLALLFATGGGLASASSLRQVGGAVDPDQKTEKGDAVRARNEWFMRGRRAPGENAATLRERAFQQRQELVRSLAIRRGIAPQATGPVGFSSGIGPAWQAIGPRPLISDPTGGQSYGDVSGRVTAIAVDQADPSGNTVYAAGAYGGVWKTTNATVSPASNVDNQTFFKDLSGRDGSLRTYSKLEDVETKVLHANGNEATVRAATKWSTAVGPMFDTRDLKVA